MRELFVFSAAVSVCTRAESPRDRNVLAARTNASDIRAAVQSGAMPVGGSHAPATGNTGRLCVRAGSGLRIDRREVTSRDAAANSSGAPLCDVEQLAARRAHNPEVARSSRAVATPESRGASSGARLGSRVLTAVRESARTACAPGDSSASRDASIDHPKQQREPLAYRLRGRPELAPTRGPRGGRMPPFLRRYA